MSDLLGAIARRTQALAAPRAQDYASSNRLFTVLIVRPGVEPAFNRTSMAFEPQPQTMVFEGPARIRPVTPSQEIDLGDGPTYWSATEISIDLGAALTPQIDDLVQITAAPPPAGSGVVGATYRVVGVAEGGHLATGFMLSCSSVSPSRWSRPTS